MTRGFPGEGPRRPSPSRPVRDLRVTVRPETVSRYMTALRRFEVWLPVLTAASLDELVGDPKALCSCLGPFLHWLYDAGRPLAWGTDLLAGLQCRWPELRGQLAPGWAMHRRWANLEPHEMRVPMPLEVLLALCVTAWTWGWQRTSVALLVGYHLILRPSELARVLRGHLALPSDVGGSL